ncbi:MAG: hypothetical protein H7831_04970 [Magnetococcus sp. WYHC-3]
MYRESSPSFSPASVKQDLQDRVNPMLQIVLDGPTHPEYLRTLADLLRDEDSAGLVHRLCLACLDKKGISTRNRLRRAPDGREYMPPEVMAAALGVPLDLCFEACKRAMPSLSA